MNFLELLRKNVCPDNSGIIQENNNLKSKIAVLNNVVLERDALKVSIDSAQKSIVQLQSENGKLAQENADLKTSLNIVEPKSYGTISYYEVSNLFASLGIRTNLSDEYFQLTTMTEAKKFSQESKVQYRKWTAEDHDCDNFSYALLGYWSQGLKSFAFGYARSATHAFNVFIDVNKELWIVEPQTNQYFKYSANTNPLYKITEVLM